MHWENAYEYIYLYYIIVYFDKKEKKKNNITFSSDL